MEYTYDIGKYTIGVDQNGEDGIGMTVAKVENGEIYFLGNCYGENARCLDLLIKENQELKKHLKVPKACNLKTLEDYKSYYEDTTREQILEDSYIDYCAYVNLAHRYSKLEKQLEEYQKDIKDLDNQNKRAFENMQLNQLKVCNMIKQQKEFINYLEDEIHTIETTFSQINGNYGLMNEKLEALKEVLQKYKEIIGVEDENKTTI